MSERGPVFVPDKQDVRVEEQENTESLCSLIPNM